MENIGEQDSRWAVALAGTERRDERSETDDPVPLRTLRDHTVTPLTCSSRSARNCHRCRLLFRQRRRGRRLLTAASALP